jgi:hypothetical protein
MLLGPLQAFRVAVELIRSPGMIMLYMKHINAKYHADRIESRSCLKSISRDHGEKGALGSFDLSAWTATCSPSTREPRVRIRASD